MKKKRENSQKKSKVPKKLKNSKLELWLTKTGLSDIHEELMEEGIYTLKELTEAKIEDLGLKPGHEIKLKKRLSAFLAAK